MFGVYFIHITFQDLTLLPSSGDWLSLHWQFCYYFSYSWRWLGKNAGTGRSVNGGCYNYLGYPCGSQMELWVGFTWLADKVAELYERGNHALVSALHPEDGGNMILRSAGILPHDYTVSKPRRPWLDSSSPWKLPVSHQSKLGWCPVIFWRVPTLLPMDLVSFLCGWFLLYSIVFYDPSLQE
jgi:hypothetical protein